MGQKLGKASLLSSASPFTNLPRRAVLTVWQSFNDVADGFGISQDELEEICTELKDELNVSKIGMAGKSAELFRILDTDKNGLIDALEFISALASLSGMRLNEIMEFLLTCYDFDGKQTLTIDEVTLALKSTASGLCKMCGINSPREDLIEQMVSTIFCDYIGTEATDSMVLRINLLAELLAIHSEIRCWFAYFGNPAQMGYQYFEMEESEKAYNNECPVTHPAASYVQAINWNVRNTVEVGDVDALQNPWISTVAMLTPVAYANQTMARKAPDSSLSIEWVYGYQSERVRSNVKYNFQGDLIYSISKYVVVYSFDTNQQYVFTGHTEEVLSLSMHPGLQLVASGDCGLNSRVIVWHSISHDILFSDGSFHRHGVIHTAFSLDGNLLATVGNDPHHTLCVYKWTENTILFTSYTDPGPCLDCCFSLHNTVVVCGDSHINFWSKAPEGFAKRRGNFSRCTLIQPITCVTHVGTSDTVVSGTASGVLFLWADRDCIKHIKAHNGMVNSIFSCSHGVITGGVDKRVRIWTFKLEPGATFDVSNYGFNPNVRSVCMSVDGTSVLIGTLGANIFEISAIDGSDLRGGPLASGSCAGSLRSVACHPSKHEFVTVGDDKRLRIWDMNTHTLIKMATFDTDARDVAYSPTGDTIVIGLGGDPSLAKCGAYVVINEEDMTIVHEARDSTCPITLVVFSPEGETLAIGAEDGAIYLYAVVDEYELIGRCVRHTSPITNLDFSADGEWIRSNSTAKDLFFFNSDDASYQSNIPSMRDVIWASYTCTYSWHTNNVHKTAYKGEEITSVHTPSPNATFVACSTNYGFVRLYSFPSVVDGAEFHRFPSHFGPIAKIRYSFDESRLISAGSHDRCLLQWTSHTYPQTYNDLDLPESEDFALEAREGDELKEEFIPKLGSYVDSRLNAEDAAQPRELPASPLVDVWLDSVVGPTQSSLQNKAVPDMSIKLEYVHGYKCQNMRNAVKYTKDDQVVYVCATIGINLNKANKSQKYFQKHTDAITSFAVSSDGALAVTGQMGHEPTVVVWDTATCQTIITLADIQMNAVSCLAFSRDSKLLGVVSLDINHTISIYDWSKNIFLCRFYGGANQVLGIAFSDDGNQLVSCGVKNLQLWNNVKTRDPTSSKPTFGEIGNNQVFRCCIYFNNMAAVGCADGHLYLFSGSSIKHAVKAHDGPVNTLDVSPDGQELATGGRDGAVRIWNKKLDCIKEHTVDSLITSQSNKVKSVAYSHDGQNLLVATRGAEVFEIALRNGSLVGGKPLIQGHGTRELWGMATHPTKGEFITSGDDATIRIWDARSFSVIKTIKTDTASRCITYSPDGKLVAVGFGWGRRAKGKVASKEGAFAILTSDLKMVHEGKDSTEPIRVIKFSPNAQYLALGSEDSCIYVYNVKDAYSRKATIKCHKAPITHIDFTADSTYIMSVDKTKRIHYSETATGVHIPSPATLRDEKWASWSSPVGWPMQGLWMCQPPEVEPLTANRSNSGALTACGNSAGRIFVSYYPCQKRAGFVGSNAHAGPISQIGWLAGDGMLISIGAKDNAIMQWKCIYDDPKDSGDEGGLSCDDSDVERTGGHEFKAKRIVKKTKNVNEAKPWQGAICPPSTPPDDDLSMPSHHIDFDYIQGIRIADSRHSLRYNEDGNIVFISTTFGIVFERDGQLQQIYSNHKNQLISLDVDPSGKFAATGEYAKNPELHIWDARTAKYVTSFKDIHRRGITSVSFSSEGEYLITLGQDEMNSIVVLRSNSKQWMDGYIMSSTSVTSNKMFWSLYSDRNDYPGVVGGKGCVYFFKCNGKTMERKKGIFGKRRKMQPVLCGVEGKPAGGELERPILTGTVTGHIYQWKNAKVVLTVTAHDAPIYSISNVKQGYITGGKDGLVKVWSDQLKLLHTYNTMLFFPQPNVNAVHCIKGNMVSSRLLVGMRGGEVYEVSLATHSYMLLIEGHSSGELHGLAVNPVDHDEYATVGDDGMLRVWSISRKTCLRRLAIDTAARAIAWTPDGTKLVIGIGGDPDMATKDGAIMYVGSSSLEVLGEQRKAKQWITDIKFSPSGELMAVASNDGKVYLHSAVDFNFVGSIDNPSKNIGSLRIDFSADSTFMRIATANQDLLHFTVADRTIIEVGTIVRDVVWASTTCPYTWLAHGCVRPNGDGINILTVSVNPRKNLVAAGYQNGDVRIYRYPCCNPEANYITISGVASQSSRLLFTDDNRYLLILDTFTRAIVTYKLTSF